MEQNFKEKMGAQLSVEPVADNGAANAMSDANAVAQNERLVALDGFNEKLSAFFGGKFNLYDKLSQDLLMRHLVLNREQNEKLATMLERDPRIAQMLADVIDGKRGAHRVERVPVALGEALEIRSPSDLKMCLPAKLPAQFTSADYQKCTRLRGRRLSAALKLFLETGVVTRTKDGNKYVYTVV
jgi:hypothetical protein